MEIKICGLTRPMEAEYLNQFQVDYAGFVFFEKSKRNVTIEQAGEVCRALSPDIRKVAVTVSPDAALVRQIQQSGFDILQVHKELTMEVLREAGIPVWYAFNIASEEELQAKQSFLESLPVELASKIEALVVDGAEYGSGQTFDWQKSRRLKKAGAQSPPDIFCGRKFVLAGGLNPMNVEEGIAIFRPDIVDVSSGVEGRNGKDIEKIRQFVNAVCNEKKGGR